MDLAKIRKKSRSTSQAARARKERHSASDSLPEDRVEALGPEPEDRSSPSQAPRAPADNGEGAVAQEPISEAGTRANEAPAAAGERLLVFDLDGEKYAIPIHEIAQIIDMPRATPVPNAPPFLTGIFSLRGRIVSIIDVARRLGLNRPLPQDPKVIVLDMGADHFGLLVDRIDLVVEVNLGALEPAPEGFKPILQEFVEGVFHHKGRAVGFLNLPMFLAFDV